MHRGNKLIEQRNRRRWSGIRGAGGTKGDQFQGETLPFLLFSLPRTDCVCLWLIGVTFGHVALFSFSFFSTGLNKLFCPCKKMTVSALACVCEDFFFFFLVFLGAGPDCITGLVTRTYCDVYHGGQQSWIILLFYHRTVLKIAQRKESHFFIF